MLLHLLFLACRTNDPVLLGVQATSADLADPGTYTKPDHVVVDVNYLAGRNMSEVSGAVNTQLGDTVSVRELDPRDGQEITLERGMIRVKDDTVYLVRVDFERPVRRGAALAAVNIPHQVDNPTVLQDEYRVRWHNGFERIRMGREARGSEMIVWVEARRFDPRE